MADNIVDSLFGPQPWQVQQQQNEAMRGEAERIARMDGFQQAKYGIGRGAGMLAGAGMEAAGYQNPAMAQAERQRSVMNTGGDMSTAAGLKAKAAEFAAAGDQQTAMKLVLLARKQEAEEQKAKLDVAKEKELDARANRETVTAENATKTDKIRTAEYEARTSGLRPGTPEFSEYVSTRVYELNNKEENVKISGIAQELVDAGYKIGTPEFATEMRKRITAHDAGKAKGNGTTVVMPGQKAAIDIPKFEHEVQVTVKPHLETVQAADMATSALRNSITTGNFASFNAAKQQLARAFSDGTISRAEVQAAGGDPGMIGGIVDATSTLFTSTPSLDTQQKMLKTLEIARNVASKKGKMSLDRMRNVGAMAEMTPKQLDTLLTFPEFNGGQNATSISDNALIQKHLKKKPNG